MSACNPSQGAVARRRIVRPRFARSLAAIAACVAAASRGAHGQTPTDAAQSPRAVLAPTLGRPTFARPGETLSIVAVADAGGAPVSVRLERSGSATARFDLTPLDDAAAALASGSPLRVRVGAEVPEATYDLIVATQSGELRSRHSVAVARIGARVRIAHLSDMNLGDPLAPAFDTALIDEINLWSPTLVVATGDYLDATHTDPETGWADLADALCRLDAPVLMACGDHDDVQRFSRYAAPGPIGEIAIGPHRVLALYDHPMAPLPGDPAQIAWLERALERGGSPGRLILVSHDGLNDWRSHAGLRGVLSALERVTSRVIWITGGFADASAAADAVGGSSGRALHVVTRQSSGAHRNAGRGSSGYRILDIEGGAARLIGDPVAGSELPQTLSVGLLRVTQESGWSATAPTCTVSVQNGHAFAVERVVVSAELRGAATDRPWCEGAALHSVERREGVWVCRAAMNVPARGAASALFGLGPRPAQPELDVCVESPATLEGWRETALDGLEYFDSPGAFATIEIHNASSSQATVFPIVRMDGMPLAYAAEGENNAYAQGIRRTLLAGERLRLRVDLSAIRVRPGPQELQLYLRASDAETPYCHAVFVADRGVRPVAAAVAATP